MKVYVKSGKDPRTTGTTNIYKVADAMGWHKPWDIIKSGNGFICKDWDWPSKSSMWPDLMNEELQSRYGITMKPRFTIDELASELNVSYEEAKDIYFDIRQIEYAEFKKEQQKMLDEIKNKTGLNCHFTKSQGNLVVPFADKTTTRFR